MENDKLVRLNLVLKALDQTVNEMSGYLWEELVENMKAIPAVDAVEVRHGRWEKAQRRGVTSYADCYAECSVCHGEPTFMGWEMHYCPHCGARMDGLYESLKRGLEEAIAYENGEVECRTETREEGHNGE